MPTSLNPYLHFRSNAREAMSFYQSVFGGDLQLMPFGDMAHEPDERDLVMHGQVTSPSGLILMGSDTPKSMQLGPQGGFTVSLSGDDETELRGYWDKLADRAQSIPQPLEKAPWGDTFGMLTDRFGTPWLVNISGRHA
jgi:PhnB protein